MSKDLAVQTAIHSWKQVIGRAQKKFQGLSEADLTTPIAPGKNRLIYLMGHLIAVHDGMFPLLGLGERLHPELDALFLSNPDSPAVPFPSGAELKTYWAEVHDRLLAAFERLSSEEWLQRHNAMSDEDYRKDPLRNRLAVLMSRTNHASFHLGQAILV